MAVIYKLSASYLEPRRLDPWYYQPEFSNIIRQISGNFPVKVLNSCLDQDRGIAGGATPLGAKYLDTGKVKFYRTSEVDEMLLDKDQAVFISEEDDKKLARSRLTEGDVILTITGAKFGKSAVVSKEHLPGNISQHSVRFRPKEDILDPYFLIAYLNGFTGQIAIWREAYGATRPAIDFPSVRSLTVPLVDRVAQKYIGDKVRQAERLRNWANLLAKAPVIIEALLKGIITEQDLVMAQTALAVGDSGLDKEILSKLDGSNKINESFAELVKGFCWESVDTVRESFHINRIKISDIENFLTAQTYRPEITSAFKNVTELGFENLQSLCIQPIRQGTTPTFSAEGEKCLKSKQTREMIINDVGYEAVNPSDPRNNSIVRLTDGDVVITRQGAGTVGRASIFTGDGETYITDSLFLIRIDKDKADPGFIVAYLRTDTGKRLIEKGVYGSTGQLNLAGDHVRNIPVLKLDKAAQNYIGDKIRLVDKLRASEKSLVSASKSLVESLIEGQLIEEQLVNAQLALDSGDNSLDRDILSRITTTGFDGDGDPLFPDLDQLYDLLAQSQQTDQH